MITDVPATIERDRIGEILENQQRILAVGIATLTALKGLKHVQEILRKVETDIQAESLRYVQNSD